MVKPLAKMVVALLYVIRARYPFFDFSAPTVYSEGSSLSSSRPSLVTLKALNGAALRDGSPHNFIALLIASKAERALTFCSSPFLSLLTALSTVTVQSSTASSIDSKASSILPLTLNILYSPSLTTLLALSKCFVADFSSPKSLDLPSSALPFAS